jgi:hypothetical protein
MKKLAFAVLIVGAVFALSQCELFGTNVEYSVNGSFSSVRILYNDETGEGVEVYTTTPWSTSFNLYSSDLPFAAALQVSNYDLVNTVILEILVEGSSIADSAGPGVTRDLLYWVD